MKVKYYEYEGGQSIVHLPKSIARAMNLEHKSQLNAEIKAVDGKAGIFLSILGSSNVDPEIALAENDLNPEFALGEEQAETPKTDVMAVKDYLERNFTFEEIRAIAKLPSPSPEQIVAKAIVQAATEAGIQTEESDETPKIKVESGETEELEVGEIEASVALDWNTFVQRMAAANEGNRYVGEVPFFAVFTSPEELRVTMPNLLAWTDERKMDLHIASDPSLVDRPEFLYPLERGQVYFATIRKSIWQKIKENWDNDDDDDDDEEAEEEEKGKDDDDD